MSTFFQEWQGLKAGFNRSTGVFNFAIEDAKETNSPFINSSWSFYSYVPQYVNIYDGNYHYFLFSWNMAGVSIIGTQEIVHQFGILGVDNFVFSPQANISVSGKSTPLSFIWNDNGQSTNLAIGASFTPNSKSVTSQTIVSDIKEVFNGEIERIIIWDRMLSGTANLNYSTPFVIPNSMFVAQNIGGTWQAAINGEDPWSGDNLKSISANVVGDWTFSNLSKSLTSVVDNSGSSLTGLQSNPASGHTLILVDSKLQSISKYILYDVNNNNQTLHFPNGLIQFVNENGLTINVGTIFYEHGIIILDNEYITGSNSGLPIISTISTSGLNIGGSTTGFNIQYISFDSLQKFQRMIIKAEALSDEFNDTKNPTGLIIQTGEQLLKDLQGSYVTTVGLYNSFNDLVAVAKTSKPIRKDSDHTVIVNVNLDF